MNKKGVFISFEGPEASGKSSQLKELQKFFKKQKIPYIITREPGGTVVSEKLRKIILSSKYNISNNEELLLLMASRLNHINTVIQPALNEGKLVICGKAKQGKRKDTIFVIRGGRARNAARPSRLCFLCFSRKPAKPVFAFSCGRETEWKYSA